MNNIFISMSLLFLTALTDCTASVKSSRHADPSKIANCSMADAEKAWKLELFDLFHPIKPHYHKIQTQIIMVLEGQLQARLNNQILLLQPGNLARVLPNVVHSLTPIKGTCRFIAIDFPDISSSKDTYTDIPLVHPRRDKIKRYSIEGISVDATCLEVFFNKMLPSYDNKYIKTYDSDDLGVYDVLFDDRPDHLWSVALLEIKATSREFHQIGTRTLIVINGKLQLEVHGKNCLLEQGQTAQIPPDKTYKLSPTGGKPAFALCVDYPACNPAD